MSILDAAACIGTRSEDERPLDEGALLEQMDRAGVAEALCTHFMTIRYDMRAGNSALLGICKRQARLHPVAIINPSLYYGVAEEIVRCAGEGFAGYRLTPARQGWVAESATLPRALEAIARTGLPAAVEINAPGSATALARQAAGSGASVIIANATYWALGEVAAVAEQNPDLYVEASLLVTPGVVELLASTLGAERLLFASGAPSLQIEPTLRMIQTAEIGENAREAILGGNARRLYRLAEA